MGQPLTQAAPRLSGRQLETLRSRLGDAIDLMTDDQILDLADTLHDALRERRNLRGRVHHRVEERLGLA